MLYSAHDTNIAILMERLTGAIECFEMARYASSVVLELKYSKQCLEADEDKLNCFGVSILFNSENLNL